jgi:hypothetical protein
MAGASADAPSGEERAAIVLVGHGEGMTELGDLVVELLEQEHVRPHLVQESDFDPAAFLSEESGASESVWAFVVTKDHNDVRLYFRDPHARRFLIRNVALRDGLDAYGREVVAQVIDSSIVSLLHSMDGISREQATAELGGVPRAEPAKLPAAAPPPALPGAAPAAVSVWLALRYGLAWAGSDLGAAQGPGLEVSLQWRTFGMGITAERFFPQSLATSQLDATVQATALRLTCDGTLAFFGSSALVFGLGAGADVLDAHVLQVHDAALTPTAQGLRILPVLRPAIAVELRLERWRFAAAAFVDVDLSTDYYQVDRPAGPTRVATPWPVRPGAALVVAWSPTLGAR